jgi:hypothetical protein
MSKFLIVIGLLLCTSQTVSAGIVVNEIAWMGTSTSTNDEWIELYNNGTTPITIDGWILQASDGSPIINLTGTISAGGFYVLERTDDSTVPNISAGVIYSGALSNDGETLILKDNTEQVIETISESGGWSAGNASSKETMQRTPSGTWITAAATPGAMNAATGTISTGSGTTSGSSGTNTGTTTPPIASSNEEKGDEDLVIRIKPDPKYSARMITPEILVQQVPLDFSSEVKRDGNINDIHGKFEWSMGDGGSFSFIQSTPIIYTYQEPGEYVVMLRYYSNVFKKDPDTIHQKTITVIPATVAVTAHPNNTIELTNTSTGDINLGGWVLQRDTSRFIFPTYTILPKDKKIIIPASVHQLSYSKSTATLATPTGYITKNSYTNLVSNKSFERPLYTPELLTTTDISTAPAIDNESGTLFSESNSISIPESRSKTPLLFGGLFGLLLSGATYGMKYIPKEESPVSTERQ